MTIELAKLILVRRHEDDVRATFETNLQSLLQIENELKIVPYEMFEILRIRYQAPTTGMKRNTSFNRSMAGAAVHQ